VEVMGFEPTASTLRMCGSQCFDQGLSYDLRGSGFRSPQVPSQSLSFPHGKDMLGHMGGGPVRGSARVSAGSRIAERTVPVLYCRQSRSSAQAIIAPAPDAADMLAGQTTEYQRFGRQELVANAAWATVAEGMPSYVVRSRGSSSRWITSMDAGSRGRARFEVPTRMPLWPVASRRH